MLIDHTDLLFFSIPSNQFYVFYAVRYRYYHLAHTVFPGCRKGGKMLSVRNITKSFGANRILDGIELDVDNPAHCRKNL